MPEATIRDINDVGPQRLQILVSEAEPLEDARREVLGHHVRPLHQLAQQLLAALGAEVERDAEFLDVVVVERAAVVEPALSRLVGRIATQDVPAPLAYGVLDANDLGPERCEEARRASTGQLAGEIADTDVRQGAVGHGGERTRIRDAPVPLPAARAQGGA